jgi:hypothetical protein
MVARAVLMLFERNQINDVLRDLLRQKARTGRPRS